MRLPLDDAEHRWGAPYLVIHRADLQRALVEAVLGRADVELSLGATVVGFVSDGERISVDLRRGPTVARDEADLLIGADGLRSQVRDRLGLGAPDQAEFTRRIAYRAIVDADGSNPHWTRSDIVLRLGPEAHLVQYPLRRGSIINLVAIIRSAWRGGSADEEWDGAADRSTLERAFAGWSKETRTLIGAPVQWRAWPLYCRPPIARFSIGRVALVGDAAHPMVPFLAQGAAQAIEDAGALGRVIAQAREVPTALAIYSRDRVARAARVQDEAAQTGPHLSFERSAGVRTRRYDEDARRASHKGALRLALRRLTLALPTAGTFAVSSRRCIRTQCRIWLRNSFVRSCCGLSKKGCGALISTISP